MTHSALVHWVPPKQIGRDHPPPVLRLVALSRFPEDGPNWSDGAWSVEIIFDRPPVEQTESLVCEAKVRFLFDTAPQERLHPGARFSVYQGPTRVADVDVLD